MSEPRKKIRFFLSSDTPKHALMNFSSPLLFLAANFMLFFSLLIIRGFDGFFPLTCLCIGFAFGTFVGGFHGPPNVFAGGFLSGKRKSMDQIDESARSVLTFFKSKEAKVILSTTTVVYMMIVVGSWYLLRVFFPLRHAIDTETFWVGSIGAGFSALFAAILNNIILIFWYALLRWNKIQQFYQPWPSDQLYDGPYDVSVMDRLRRLCRSIGVKK